jgi:spermidine synthase
MRALAHIPLLSMDEPRSALVIGFGVGNTTHAASLHPTMQRIEVADLSKDVLAAAGYFSDANGNVLENSRVSVFVNDGRQHLQIVEPESYDLITLEPPPIAYAGVAALYSRDFYSLAKTRLKPGGFVSQWLPAYQVPTSTTLAMIRAFIDVFPNAVLLSAGTARTTRSNRIVWSPRCLGRPPCRRISAGSIWAAPLKSSARSWVPRGRSPRRHARYRQSPTTIPARNTTSSRS